MSSLSNVKETVVGSLISERDEPHRAVPGDVDHRRIEDLRRILLEQEEKQGLLSRGGRRKLSFHTLRHYPRRADHRRSPEELREGSVYRLTFKGKERRASTQSLLGQWGSLI